MGKNGACEEERCENGRIGREKRGEDVCRRRPLLFLLWRTATFWRLYNMRSCHKCIAVR
jgi:hypothetical protein